MSVEGTMRSKEIARALALIVGAMFTKQSKQARSTTLRRAHCLNGISTSSREDQLSFPEAITRSSSVEAEWTEMGGVFRGSHVL